MRELTATEAARRFAEILDAVEHRNETFTIVRRGRTIARLAPATRATGAEFKQLLREYPPDEAWADELAELRAGLQVQERSWPA